MEKYVLVKSILENIGVESMGIRYELDDAVQTDDVLKVLQIIEREVSERPSVQELEDKIEDLSMRLDGSNEHIDYLENKIDGLEVDINYLTHKLDNDL